MLWSRVWSRVTKIFVDNPTLAVTISYVYFTAVGMAYSASLYSRFGINIVDYSEIGDFLLAAFRNPFIIPLAVIQALIGIYLLRRSTRYTGFARSWLVPIMVVIIIVYSVAIPYCIAVLSAFSIQEGHRTRVEVRYRAFEGSAGQIAVPGLEVIGATQKAAFFYNVDEKHTVVVPQAQIVSIEVPKEKMTWIPWGPWGMIIQGGDREDTRG